MNAEVSRALAVVKQELRLGSAATEELIREFDSVTQIQDLPLWIREVAANKQAPPSVPSSEDAWPA